MKLAMPTEKLRARFGDIKALKIIAEAGFDAYDYSMFYMWEENENLSAKNYKQYIKTINDAANEYGISCVQTHAPFPTSTYEEKDNKVIYERLVRAIEISGMIGAKCVIIHPQQHLKYIYNIRELYEMNMEFYGSLIPYAKAAGVKIAVENMFQWDERRRVITDSTCSHSEEFCKYIDDLNSPHITACLDIGHCGVVGDDPVNMIHKLGKRIGALHVHDNKYKNDDHAIPYAGLFDWNAITAALADIDYSGDFTFETDGYYNGMDDEFIPTATKFLHDTGRHLISLIEKRL